MKRRQALGTLVGGIGALVSPVALLKPLETDDDKFLYTITEVTELRSATGLRKHPTYSLMIQDKKGKEIMLYGVWAKTAPEVGQQVTYCDIPEEI